MKTYSKLVFIVIKIYYTNYVMRGIILVLNQVFYYKVVKTEVYIIIKYNFHFYTRNFTLFTAGESLSSPCSSKNHHYTSLFLTSHAFYNYYTLPFFIFKFCEKWFPI